MSGQDSLRPRRIVPSASFGSSPAHRFRQGNATVVQAIVKRWRRRTSLTVTQTFIILITIFVVITFYFLIDITQITDRYTTTRQATLTRENEKEQTRPQLTNHMQLKEEPFGFTNLSLLYDSIITQEELISQGYKKIVAVGDLHGDLNQCRTILQRAGVINEYDNWIAPKGTILMQTGDIFDRGPQSVDVLRFFWKLRQLAQQDNNQGLVLQILGMLTKYTYSTNIHTSKKKQIICKVIVCITIERIMI